MRDALVLRLEQLSYYEHRGLSGGQEKPVCACRTVDIRGSRYYVLSRIQDAGLDFTNRTNFLAHHLAFTAEELKKLPVPPIIFRDWNGWITSWTKEPCVFAGEDWGNLYELAVRPNIPAHAWAKLTGDAVHGTGLIDGASGLFLNTDGLKETDVLGLFAESMELLEVRDVTGDWRSGAWQFSFTTALQEQDQSSDFRWRGVSTDAPVLRKLLNGGQSVVPINSIRASRPTETDAIFARNGHQPLSIQVQPEDVRISEGNPAILQVVAAGAPPASQFEWYTCSREGRLETLLGTGASEIQLDNPPIGVSRYAVKVGNARGESVTSRVVQVSVDPQIRLASRGAKGPANATTPAVKVTTPLGGQKSGVAPKVWTADAEEFAQHLETVRRNERKRRNTLLTSVALVLFLGLAFGFYFCWRIAMREAHKLHEMQTPERIVEMRSQIKDIQEHKSLLLHFACMRSAVAEADEYSAAIEEANKLIAAKSTGSTDEVRKKVAEIKQSNSELLKIPALKTVFEDMNKFLTEKQNALSTFVGELEKTEKYFNQYESSLKAQKAPPAVMTGLTNSFLDLEKLSKNLSSNDAANVATRFTELKGRWSESKVVHLDAASSAKTLSPNQGQTPNLPDSKKKRRP